MTIQSSPSIIINNASLIYQAKPLFSNLYLELPAAQCTCLLGPSGVGKTSLLRLLAGLNIGAMVSAEIITSDGLPLHDRIAYMAQTDGLLPWLTALENVMLSLRLRGKKILAEDNERAKTLLSEVGLQTAIHKKPPQLSGGMRQRVALARTLFEDKPVVLMDEPFASLDAITKWRLQTLIAHLLKNKTVLLITHDPLEALRLAQHIHVLAGLPAILDEALILSDQPPRDLTHAQLPQWQAELMQRLEKAQVCMAE